MTPADALTLLGLPADADRPRIEREVQRRLASLRAAMPIDQSAIDRLRRAWETLAGTRPLTRTQVADLPAPAPAVTGAGLATPPAHPHDTPVGSPPDRAGLAPGDVLAGRYEVRAEVGRGGMGVVYAAFDRVRQEEVAVKVLLPHLLRSPDARARFGNEIAVATRLSHPRIVRVFDVHEAGGQTFLTMELLTGSSLRAEIDRRRGQDRRFSPDEVRHVADQLCDALHYAHATTVHRDVKPENVWLEDDGAVKLMDFGIARLLTPQQLTTTGVALGTAYYMAPEQLRPAADVDARADQYAVAAVLYELLTGEVPAGAIRPPHERRRGVPAGLSAAVMRGLSSRPDERFPDVAAFKVALRSAAGPRRPRAVAAGVAAAVVLAAGLTWAAAAGVLPRPESGRPTDEPRPVAQTDAPRPPVGPVRPKVETARVEAALTRAELALSETEAELAGLPADLLPPQPADARATAADALAALAANDPDALRRAEDAARLAREGKTQAAAAARSLAGQRAANEREAVDGALAAARGGADLLGARNKALDAKRLADRAADGLPRPFSPESALRAAEALDAGDFAHAAKLFADAKEEATEVRRRLDAEKSARRQAETAASTLTPVLSGLPPALQPAEAAAAAARLQEGKSALEMGDLAKATMAAEEAEQLYKAARDKADTVRKQYDTARSALKDAAADEERWQKTAKGVAEAGWPKEAKDALAGLKDAKARLDAGDLTAAADRADAAAKLFRTADADLGAKIKADNQKWQVEAATTRGQAEKAIKLLDEARAEGKTKLAEAEKKHEDARRAYADANAAFRAAQNTNPYNKAAADAALEMIRTSSSEEIRTSSAKSAWKQAVDHVDLARANTVASGHLSAGEALLRDRPKDALREYQEALRIASSAYSSYADRRPR